jgi:hypothetical protein
MNFSVLTNTFISKKRKEREIERRKEKHGEKEQK